MAVLTKITSRSLADNAVSSAKIQDGAIAVADVADGSITANKLASDAVTTVKIANDAVTAAKIPAGAVVADVGTGGITATQLATDAVTTIKIANDAVDADKLASNAVVTASIVDANITAAKIGTAAVTSAKMGDVIEVKPHIKYGMLYPSLKDAGGTPRQSDGVAAVVASTVGPAGSTITSSLYGTVQSDGRMYYYTDVKGSKPIKDPRIGSHFGSQRHPLNSIQLLEQETATHGKGVYTIDGREWMRYVAQGGSPEYGMTNNLDGHHLITSSGTSAVSEFFEIVSYFSDANIIASRYAAVAAGHFKWSIDGGSETLHTAIRSTVATPLGDRYVDEGSVHNIGCGATLGIHTLKIRNTDSGDSTGQVIRTFGFELIAQDTTSATTRSQIQIQPQNVVSYGKRFAVGVTQSATATDKKALHYNPFAFKTDGTTAWASGAHNGTGWPTGLNSAHNIDTATSLGLNKWLHSSNYYKPYNGGRVVIWVDSSGNIKTSVNVMPPNARSIATSGTLSGAVAKTNASIANTQYKPTFEAGAVDDFPTTALSEVAKTFHFREFGNGSVNGNANYADASMMQQVADDITYVMDDGLTGLMGNAVKEAGQMLYRTANASYHCITFIGTGVSKAGGQSGTAAAEATIAQNLPYGTHILKHSLNGGSTTHADITIDGVVVSTNIVNDHLSLQEITFHQPKMPPIPEDAVVISDYMLMADHVATTASGQNVVSKGIRRVDCTRDVFYNSGGTAFSIQQMTGGDVNASVNGTRFAQADSSSVFELVAFCTNQIQYGYATAVRYQTWSKDTGGGYATVASNALTKSGTGPASLYYPTAATPLGIVKHKTHGAAAASSAYLEAIDVVSPIHTSSHYQSFETPYLHELVGGDRNMEQNNLVVTGDGKTWDEVTRDTSYIGSTVVNLASTTGDNDSHVPIKLDEARGVLGAASGLGYKDSFVLGYDRLICLKAGNYFIECPCLTATSGEIILKVNGTNLLFINGTSGIRGDSNITASVQLIRGDYVQIFGGYWTTTTLSQFRIYRLTK